MTVETCRGNVVEELKKLGSYHQSMHDLMNYKRNIISIRVVKWG